MAEWSSRSTDRESHFRAVTKKKIVTALVFFLQGSIFESLDMEPSSVLTVFEIVSNVEHQRNMRMIKDIGQGLPASLLRCRFFYCSNVDLIMFQGRKKRVKMRRRT